MSRVVAGFEASTTTLGVHAVGEEHPFNKLVDFRSKSMVAGVSPFQ